MKLKADLSYDDRFDGLSAKLFIENNIVTVLFNSISKEWAAISFDMGEKEGDLNFYRVADKIGTQPKISLDEAIAVVRATMAKEAA